MTFFFKDDKIIGVYRYGWKLFGKKENKPVMKAGKEETTCLLGVAGKCSVKVSVHLLVKGKKGQSPARESVIKDGKGKRSCLMDGEKRSVHAKARGESWEMKSQREVSNV